MLKYIVFCLALAATAVSAHSKREGTLPAADAVVAEVSVIGMNFDAPMLVTAITVTGPEGAVALSRETAMEAAQAFRALPETALSAGDYEVEWRGLAADGHVMQGGFGFTVTAD